MWLALHGLRRHPRRTLLTASGVAVGACAYMLLVGSAHGLLRNFHAVTTFFGADFVIQQAGATSPWGSLLSELDVKALQSVRGVAHVSRIGLGKTRLAGTPYFLVFGLDPAEPLLGRVPVLAGRQPRSGANEMLLGEQAAARLRKGVMQTLVVRGHPFTITGVYRTGHAVLDAGGIFDLDLTQRLFNLRDAVNIVFLDLARGTRPETAAAGLARARPGLEIMPAGVWGESYGQFELIDTFARFLAGLAVLIAALGVSTVLHMSIIERTGEFAVLRAIGWTRQRVAALVVTESAAVTLVGVVMAFVLSELFLVSARSAAGGSTFTATFLPVHVATRLLIEALAVSCAAGLLGTVAPLVRAIRIRPARALRGE